MKKSALEIENLFDYACSELEILQDEKKKDVLRDVINYFREREEIMVLEVKIKTIENGGHYTEAGLKDMKAKLRELKNLPKLEEVEDEEERARNWLEAIERNRPDKFKSVKK